MVIRPIGSLMRATVKLLPTLADDHSRLDEVAGHRLSNRPRQHARTPLRSLNRLSYLTTRSSMPRAGSLALKLLSPRSRLSHLAHHRGRIAQAPERQKHPREQLHPSLTLSVMTVMTRPSPGVAAKGHRMQLKWIAHRRWI
jgi:hypothetical protein